MSKNRNEFLEAMHELIPDELDKFEKSLNEEPPTSIRFHPEKKSKFHANLEKIPWCNSAFYLDKRPSFTKDPLFHAGAYYVQEASSMILEFVLTQFIGPSSHPSILDLCAAPGGKSSHILSFLRGKGLLISNEVIKSRSFILRQNLTKWGYANSIITQNDPSAFSKANITFDCILIDAPCSGEGMSRKDNSILDEWSRDNINFCSSRQRRIIGNIVPRLQENGILIYSTCTYNHRENLENCYWMAEEFGLESMEIPFEKKWNILELKNSGTHGYQFFPHRQKGEGFFISVLKKTRPVKNSKSKKNNQSQYFVSVSKSKLKIFDTWVKDSSAYRFYIDRNNKIYMLPNSIDVENILNHSLNLLSLGLEIGKLKHDVFIPSHSLALSTIVHPDIKKIDLEKGMALKYLKGEAIRLEIKTKAWILVCYQGLALGWIKALGNRINNYYPKEFRIRMSLDT
jgi:16S rRNA C967 or C1407 C5-methylase (RsmB/RsmF family)/NOL1/NOP2/fmu family ribosome biogenesis protein